MNLQAKFHPTIVYNLLRIQKQFPSAIIAGGAVRDLVLGKPIKDLDIFIDGTPNGAITLNKIKNRTHWIHSKEPFFRKILQNDAWHVAEGKTSYNPDPSIDIVLNLYNPDEDFFAMSEVGSSKVANIDIIFLLKPALDYFNEDFDFNLCKVFFDGKKYRFTSEFLQDAKNRTITLAGQKSRKSINYSLYQHLPRIKEKYPGYRGVIPDVYKEIIGRK